jgi:hypothetical protein
VSPPSGSPPNYHLSTSAASAASVPSGGLDFGAAAFAAAYNFQNYPNPCHFFAAAASANNPSNSSVTQSAAADLAFLDFNHVGSGATTITSVTLPTPPSESGASLSCIKPEPESSVINNNNESLVHSNNGISSDDEWAQNLQLTPNSSSSN